MFVTNISGTLMKISENPDTRYEFEIWFDYTKRAINLIREGAMVAVSNFATNNTETHMSILEIVSILPMHYALGSDISGYPGFVVEAAHNACLDWEQETESTEDTTKIRCIAIPTNLELKLSNNQDNFQADENLPMIGSRVELLNNEYTQKAINLGIDHNTENILTVGQLVRDPEVNIWLRIEDLMKVHFGVFGFTGAGKSNFLSTLINRILNESRDHVKIVFFDLMSEYTALLIDKLVQLPNSMIVNLGENTVPQSLLDYFNNPDNNRLVRATNEFTRSTLFPKRLKRRENDFRLPIRQLIEERKIRIWRDADQTIGQFVEGVENEILRGNMGASAATVRQLVQDLKDNYRTQHFNATNWQQIQQRLAQAEGQQLSNTAAANVRELRQRLENEYNRPRTAIPQAARITIPEIINILNNADTRSLIIIQSHDPNLLRHFSWMLGNFTYEQRRTTGQITPLVSFIFDEADEFIPQGARDTYAESSDIAMTLARRGRKFGLGIGIATQRVIYLNTNIMAQPHTYFVSKLPRQSDRQRISEAFGVSEDIFRQTFKFEKGDWLLVSYDATGLDAIPIPIHVENADERIGRFLDEVSRT